MILEESGSGLQSSINIFKVHVLPNCHASKTKPKLSDLLTQVDHHCLHIIANSSAYKIGLEL